MKEAILLVDDETIILLSLRQELRSALGSRYRYETAKSAEEAIEVFAELTAEGFTVILVISDWLMPGMKGDEFLMIVHDRYPEVRTIMLSGQTDESKLGTLRAAGAMDAFVRKPWDNSALIGECARLLGEAEGETV